jgi:hypothetical protein
MVRNRREFGKGSREEESPPDLLDRRFRALSAVGSGSKVMTSVGIEGPGFRYWMFWISQLVIDRTGIC